jgi:hypothetical protein
VTTEQPDRIGPYKITRELAQAQHRTGDSAAAIQTQRHAISIMPADYPERAGCEQRPAEYEAALGAEPVGADGDQEWIPARAPGGVQRPEVARE